MEKAIKPGMGGKQKKKGLLFQGSHTHSLISVGDVTNLGGDGDVSCRGQKDPLTYGGALGMTDVVQLFLPCFLLDEADHGWEIVFSHLVEAAEGRADVLLRGAAPTPAQPSPANHKTSREGRSTP